MPPMGGRQPTAQDERKKATLITREESPTKRPMGQPGKRKRKREGGGEKGVTLQICCGRGNCSPPNTGREPDEATHGAAREEEEGRQEGEESDPTYLNTRYRFVAC